MRRSQGRALRARIELGLAWVLVLGCGSPASPARSSPAPSVPDVAAAPVVDEAPIVQQVSVALRGTTDDVALDSLDLGDASRVGRADLRIGDEAFSIPIPGCARGAGYGWTVEHADPGPGPWARFNRTSQEPPTDGEDQLPHEIGITGSIVAFGQRVTPVSIEPREGGTFYFTFTTSHPDVDEGSPTPAQQLLLPGQPAEQGLGDHVLTLALGEPGILGCRAVRLTVLDPGSQVVDVTDGGTATVRTSARMRLGDVTIRWGGVGEARRRIGGDVMILFFEGTLGDSVVEPFSCGGAAPCTFHDVLIEPLALQEAGAQSTFRLSRMPPGSPPP